MSYLHSMTCYTHGIRPTQPARWRSFDAMCGVFWNAQAGAGAKGYYSSPDPRIVLFFNDVSRHVRISDRSEESTSTGRPMLRASYVPAGMPLWTRFTDTHEFSHLDLHLRGDWLLNRLSPALGASTARTVINRPVEAQDLGDLTGIAKLLVSEISDRSRNPLFAESLALSLATGLLDLPNEAEDQALQFGGLTPANMRALRDLVEGNLGQRLSNAAMADAVGLSESWFCHAFKKTTGTTPQHWQQERRVGLVKSDLVECDDSLAEVAARFGFADQAHLTRVFRQYEGTTPSAWRRTQRAG